MLYNENQHHIMNTHFIYIFSPSLLMSSCFGNIQCFNWSCFLLHILGMSSRVNGRSLLHPSNQVLFSFTLKSFKIESVSSALASMVVRARLFISKFFLARQWSSVQKKVGGGSRSLRPSEFIHQKLTCSILVSNKNM